MRQIFFSKKFRFITGINKGAQDVRRRAGSQGRELARLFSFVTFLLRQKKSRFTIKKTFSQKESSSIN